jgi:hypothetical protein
MSRATSVLIIAIFTITMPACTLDPTGDHLKQQVQTNDLQNSRVEDPSVAPEAATFEEASTSLADDVINSAANCSQVNFCNAPGSDGTECKQLGCSLLAAQNECKNEAAKICGAPVCPFIFITSSNQHITMNCDGKVCSGGSAISCGGRCCSTSAKFCGSGGQCCDGVTPTPGCPT